MNDDGAAREGMEKLARQVFLDNGAVRQYESVSVAPNGWLVCRPGIDQQMPEEEPDSSVDMYPPQAVLRVAKPWADKEGDE